jgi:hypothetical protein
MMSKRLNYLLVALIALQSLAAMGDFHPFDPFEMNSALLVSVDTPDIPTGTSQPTKEVDSSTNEANAESQHCCHCHSLWVVIATVNTNALFLIERKLPEHFSRYQFDRLLPDLRPPIA